METRRLRIFLAALLGTFVITRLMLHMSPDSDFDVAGYNIHHLFTGLLLIAVGGIPLALFPQRRALLDVATAVFGIGLSLSLDEWVYLIATDGTNASYLLPVSLRGAIIVISLATVYVALLYWASRRKR